MIDLGVWEFCLVAGALTLVPGADTMLVLHNTLRDGRAAGLSTTLGICSGGFLHATLSALGLSLLLTRSATAFLLVKLLGAAYLVWLGAVSLWSARRGTAEGRTAPSPQSGETVKRQPTSVWRGPMVQGLMTNLLNPKVSVFYLALLPQFLDADDPVLAKSLFLAAIHFAMGIVWLGAIATLVVRIRAWIERGRTRRWLEALSGAALIALGLRLALEKPS